MLVANGADSPSQRQGRFFAAGIGGNLEFHERVLGTQPLHDVVGRIGTHSHHPMTIATSLLQWNQDIGRLKAAVDNRQRIVGDFVPQLTSIGVFTCGKRPKTNAANHVGAKGDQGDGAEQRISSTLQSARA